MAMAVTARREAPPARCERDELAALVAALPAGDERARAFLVELRRVRIEEVRAIERYLGLRPARSERRERGR